VAKVLTMPPIQEREIAAWSTSDRNLKAYAKEVRQTRDRLSTARAQLVFGTPSF
jgi:hypothetical protein